MILAAVVLAVGLAILWMSLEVNRTRRIRDLNAPATSTNMNSLPSPKS